MNEIDIEKILLKNKNKFKLVHTTAIRAREIIIKNQKSALKSFCKDKPTMMALKELSDICDDDNKIKNNEK